MNIFFLHRSPSLAAKLHVDKHCNKMIIEYAQLLCTAKRMLDGKYSEYFGSKAARKGEYLLPGEYLYTTETMVNGKLKPKVRVRNSKLYRSCYHNHPCAIWVRKSAGNYQWLYSLFRELSKEYTRRYGKAHKTFSELGSMLAQVPDNIPSEGFSVPPMCMPDEYHTYVGNLPDDSDLKARATVIAYRNYYIHGKDHIGGDKIDWSVA